PGSEALRHPHDGHFTGCCCHRASGERHGARRRAKPAQVLWGLRHPGGLVCTRRGVCDEPAQRRRYQRDSLSADEAVTMSASAVNVVIGPGSIGQAIARRVSVGKHVLLADLREENAAAAAKTLSDAGYEVSTGVVDISSRDSIQA